MNAKNESGNYHRIAIITGATSGIGEATARKFIKAGFAVVGNARNAAKLREMEQELGGAFRGVEGDAADSPIIESLFVVAKKHFGREADIVIANAGRGLGGSVSEADISQFEEILRLKEALIYSSMSRVAGQIGEIATRTAQVVAGTTMPSRTRKRALDLAATRMGRGLAGELPCCAAYQGE